MNGRTSRGPQTKPLGATATGRAALGSCVVLSALLLTSASWAGEVEGYITETCPTAPPSFDAPDAVIFDVCADDPTCDCGPCDCPTSGDGSDDTAALQCLIDEAARQATHGVVRLPPGATYDVRVQRRVVPASRSNYDVALRLRSNVTLRTVGSDRPATLRLMDAQGDFHSILGSVDEDLSRWATDLHDSWVINLTIDGNSAGNPILVHDAGTPDEAVEGGRQTAIFMAPYPGLESTNVGIVGVRVLNNNGVWSFHTQRVRDVCVARNHVEVATAANRAHLCERTDLDLPFEEDCGDKDRSQLYIHGPSSLIADNEIFADAPGYVGTRTGIETHGHGVTVRGNTIRNLSKGMNIVNHNDDGARQEIAANRISGAKDGVMLWSWAYVCERDQLHNVDGTCQDPDDGAVPPRPLPVDRFTVDIHDNEIDIDPEPWRASATSDAQRAFRPRAISVQNGDPAACVIGATTPCFVRAHFGEIRVRGNVMSFADMDPAYAVDDHDRYAAAVSFLADNQAFDRLDVVGNRLTNSLGNGIYIKSNIDRVRIDRNRIENPGRSAIVTNGLDSGIYINDGRLGGVQAASIRRNCFRDDQPAATMTYGISTGGTVCTPATCGVRDNALERTDPTVVRVDDVDLTHWNYTAPLSACP